MSETTISSRGWQAKERADRLSAEDRTSKPAEVKTQPAITSSESAERPSFSSGIAMTRVQFKVDTNTNDVVILIREKSTDQVLRTIPAEAIKDLPPGQLVDIYG